MDFRDTPEEAAFRAEVRAWLEANAQPRRSDADRFDAGMSEDERIAAARAWQRRKAAAGYAAITWPKEWGGAGGSPMQQVIYNQEEARFLVPRQVFENSLGQCLPTVAMWAIPELKERHVPQGLRGDAIWCQLFSEPAAGSDTGGIRTRATRDGDEWVISGQKVWTSGAHFCDYGILITRTDPTLPKHKGLTMFFLDMKSPGVEVRPIKQASGHSGFNEVYFTNVRIPDVQRLGKVNDGWNVSLTTLMNERFSIGARLATGVPEFFDFASGVKLADGTPAIDDKAVRENLATWAARANGLKYTAYRAISSLSRGERPGPENSIGKLVAAPMMQDIAMYALELQGQMGAVARDDASPAGKLYQMLYGAIGMRIAGGTDEVMRNIIAERVLGLPGDIRVDKDAPFNQIPTKGR